ncbi:MAG: hypothetical protein EXS35_08050 [Pedosphaera sp.]|nr:hypothetical protein [Pedosphaera sp.]
MKAVSPKLILFALGTVCFALATLLQPRAAQWGGRAQSDNLVKVFLGEGRRLFANHFYTQADVVLHSGYYPSIFDQARRNMKSSALSGDSDADHDAHESPGETQASKENDKHDHESEHEKKMAFLQEPKDWIERFGRKFLITEHTHLSQDKESEILPWLRVSAELDPQRVETYTVAAYWLKRNGKLTEAEQFLREGLRNNPDSYEILFDLGRLYSENKHEIDRARNLWTLALARWNSREAGKTEQDLSAMEGIAVHLATLEADAGNHDRAISLFKLAMKASPHPEELQARIDELRKHTSPQP